MKTAEAACCSESPTRSPSDAGVVCVWRVVAIIGLIGSLSAGYVMTTIESQAGNTVAEAFYNQMGWLGMGLGVLLFGICMLLEQLTKQNEQVIELLKVRSSGGSTTVARVEARSLPPL